MATVVITITDNPSGVTTRIESTPDIPLAKDGVVDVEEATAGQALAVAVMMEVADRFGADWRVFFRGG